MQSVLWSAVACTSYAGLALASQVPVTSAAPTFASQAALSMVALAADPAPTPAGTNFFEGWKRNVDLGLNGSEGNSQNFSGRGLLGATRTAEDMVTKAGISYVYGTSDSEKNKSRGEAFVRNDWVFTDSPWGVFAQGKLEYDEFQEWDWRASFVVGPSYQLIKNDRTSLKLRAGLGGSYAWGGTVDEEFRPEAMLGADFEHKLTERQKLTAFVEYYPSLDDPSEFRLVAGAGWELLVDPESNMFLKAGAVNRYDSETKAPNKRNDFEYFLTLSWIF
jgi:putative salt-induced outer membrane protein YdiY